MKRIMLCLAVLMFMCVPIAQADSIPSNLEIFDEMTLGVKIQSQDIILKSKYIDIGAEIGAWDISNYNTSKLNMFAMGTITIKGISIFDLTK